MKVFSFIALAGILLVACEKKSTTTIDENGNTTTVETVGIDRQRVDSTAEKVEDATQKAAEKTGDALQDAGAAIKRGAENANDNLKATTVKRDTVKVIKK